MALLDLLDRVHYKMLTYVGIYKGDTELVKLCNEMSTAIAELKRDNPDKDY